MNNNISAIRLHLSPQTVSNDLIHCQTISLNYHTTDEGVQPSSVDYEKRGNDVENEYFYALVIGLPIEASYERIQEIFAPMKEECHRLTFLTEHKQMTFQRAAQSSSSSSSLKTSSSSTNTITWQQSKLYALATFTSISKRNLFTTLYHNMPLTSFSDAAPCLCVDVTSVHIHFDEFNHENISQFSALSLSPSILSLIPCHTSFDLKNKSTESSLPAFIPLPTCALCMRRLRFVSSELLHLKSDCNNAVVNQKSNNEIDGESAELQTGDIAVGRSFHCVVDTPLCDNWLMYGKNSRAKSEKKETQEENSSQKVVRCLVCGIYDYVQKKHFASTKSTNQISKLSHDVGTRSSTVGQCVGCGLSENIWICMTCGYAGCGRYTARHAHLHYLSTCPSTISSGEENHKNNFPHPYSMELATGRIWDYSLDRYLNYEGTSSTGAVVAGGHMLSMPPYGSHSSSTAGNLTGQILPGYSVHHNLSFERYDHTPADSTTGNDHISGKLLVSYEDTVSSSSYVSSSNNSTTTKLEIGYEEMLERELQEQTLHYEKLLARETVRAMEYAFRNADEKKHTKSSSSIVDANSSSGTMEDGLQMIEKMKMEISSMEMVYQSLQQQVRIMEEEVKVQKMRNDDVVREHKTLKEEENQIQQDILQIRHRMNETVEDLEQQIRDLTFYVHTKQKLEASPYREELDGSTLITTVNENTVTPAKNKKGRGGNNSGGKSNKRR